MRTSWKSFSWRIREFWLVNLLNLLTRLDALLTRLDASVNSWKRLAMCLLDWITGWCINALARMRQVPRYKVYIREKMTRFPSDYRSSISDAVVHQPCLYTRHMHRSKFLPFSWRRGVRWRGVRLGMTIYGYTSARFKTKRQKRSGEAKWDCFINLESRAFYGKIP